MQEVTVKAIESIDQKEALRYLGYVGGVPDDNTQQLLNSCEEQVLSVLEPRYLYQIFDTNFTPKTISLNGCTLELAGYDICNFLTGCEKVVVLCATLSINVDRYIKLTQYTDMAKAVIADSIASVAIEILCDNIAEEIKEKFPEYHQTTRFSPGYGDFPIEMQKELLTVLDAQKKIGITATDDCMLTPKKSVTAVIGLSTNEITENRHGCETCNLRDTCLYREKGETCNEQISTPTTE